MTAARHGARRSAAQHSAAARITTRTGRGRAVTVTSVIGASVPVSFGQQAFSDLSFPFVSPYVGSPLADAARISSTNACGGEWGLVTHGGHARVRRWHKMTDWNRGLTLTAKHVATTTTATPRREVSGRNLRPASRPSVRRYRPRGAAPVRSRPERRIWVVPI